MITVIEAWSGLMSASIDEGEHMNWQDRIVMDGAVLAGKPTIRGTRISVEFVIDLLARGWQTEDLLKEYGHLTADDVRACLAYASESLQSERVYPTPL